MTGKLTIITLLPWPICVASQLKIKPKKIQDKALRFMNEDRTSPPDGLLLDNILSTTDINGLDTNLDKVCRNNTYAPNEAI